MSNNPNNWLGLGYYQFTLNGIAPAGGVPYKPRPIANLIAGPGVTITIADNPNEGPTGATDVTITASASAGAVLPRTPVNNAGITAATLALLVAANNGAGAWLDVDCSAGAVAIGMPILPANTPIIVDIVNGNPQTHAITLTTAVAQTIQHQNGPATATYTTAAPTLQDTIASPGTSALTNVWVFDAPGYLGTTSVYRATGVAGSYTVN